MNKLKKLNNLRMSALAGLLLMMVGCLIFAASLFSTWLAQRTAAAPSILQGTYQSKNPRVSGKPSRIQIPSVGIDLKVIPGYYNSQARSWTLSLTDAQWGVNSAQPNNKSGLTFIYGHFRTGVFLNLPKITPGAKAIVTTANGHKFTYIYRGSDVVSPTNTQIFDYKGKPILMLQTCTGVWYQNRQLFMFDLKRVQ